MVKRGVDYIYWLSETSSGPGRCTASCSLVESTGWVPWNTRNILLESRGWKRTECQCTQQNFWKTILISFCINTTLNKGRIHQESMESHSGMAQTRIWCLSIEPRLMAGWVWTRRVFPKWTMVKWEFSIVINTDMVHSEIAQNRSAVSYTHLTLPTILLV